MTLGCWLAAVLARCRTLCTGPIPILVCTGYFSFFALLNLLALSFLSHYNLIDGAKGFVSLVTPRPVRAAVMFFDNSKTRGDSTVEP